MLHKCANPACNNQFRRLREGKLFQVETEYFPNLSPRSTGELHHTHGLRRVEYYWLCDQCAPYITLSFDQDRGVATVPLPDDAGQKVITSIEPGERKRPVRSMEVRPLASAATAS
ncbi:MAG TPA: hypothetical protein VFA89_24595 [Terriglobales bacterium]|nr:hypothetical protein [Terriglobales bacterium]